MTRQSRRLRSTLRSVEALIPIPWDIDALVARLAERRGRPIRLIAWDFAAAEASGMWLSTAEADYIFYAENSTPTRREQIIGHELGHLVFDHESTSASPDAPTTVDAVRITPDISPELRRRVLMRSAYDDADEAEAEEFGTRLLRLADLRARASAGSDELSRITDALR